MSIDLNASASADENYYRSAEMTKFDSLRLAPAEEALEPPLSIDEITKIREQRGLQLVSKPVYIPDGVYASGWDLDDSEMVAVLQQNIQKTLELIDSVPDEHFKPRSLIDLALAKEVWFELDDVNLKVSVCFRFTIDDCDAGKRMMSATQEKLSAHYETQGFNSTVEMIHGGKEWNGNDIQDENLKSAVLEALEDLKNMKKTS